MSLLLSIYDCDKHVTINSKSVSLQLMYNNEEGLAHILNHTKWGWGYVQIYTSYYTTFHPPCESIARMRDVPSPKWYTMYNNFTCGANYLQ